MVPRLRVSYRMIVLLIALVYYKVLHIISAKDIYGSHIAQISPDNACNTAGVNRADLLQVKGLYPPPPGAPDIPGLEVSGTVEASDGNIWQKGDKICALLPGGGYAEYVTVAEGQVLPIPQNITMTEAASLPEACFTVWKNLFHLAKLKAGERVLIQAGASGIGVMAIQMAAAFGAEVYATAGSDAKCNACENLGAHKAINYKQQDYVAEINTLTQGRGVDVILDVLGGGEDLQKNLSSLAHKGRMVMIALLSGKQAHVNLAPLMLKELAVMGSMLRSDTAEAKTLFAKALREYAWPLFAQGKIKPVIDSAFPLEEANAAHQRMAGREHTGKIVLTLT